MRYISTLSVAAVVAAMAVDADASLVINEIMQSNIDCVYVDHEYPDSWVELYNGGTAPVSLAGWRIGVKNGAEKCYALPGDASVPAGGYLLVYCDKSETGGLHTDFRLESGKDGAVYLYDADGRLADSLTGLKKMPAANVAYGRVVDGGPDWAYMISATPGVSNSTTAGTASKVSPDPVFSHDSHVAVKGRDAFSLTVSMPADAPADAMLCVTADGREPVAADAVDGMEWTREISSNTVVRARVVSPGMLPSRSVTRSFIYLDESSPLRVVSITGDPADFYDAERGIFYGAEYSETMTDEEAEASNWNYKWRRPVNVEYFTAGEHSPVVNQLGETRIHGGVTRRYPQKSLTVYANKRFGTKRYDTSDFWPDKPGVTAAKSFVIRNGGNMFTSTRINDALAQRLMGRDNKAVDYQAYSPCIYFINGEYMGIGDLRERSDEDYIAANYTDDAGDELEDIDMIENWDEVKAGSIDALNEFVQWYGGDGVTLDGLRERMDVDNFIDQLVIQWYGGNRDFFDNNIVCWRPTADGGRWRWVLKDIDQWANPFNIPFCRDGDYYEWCEAFYDLKPYRHRLFRLIYEELPEARELFLDRMLVCLGDRLQPAAVTEVVNEMYDEIIAEYPRHAQRYFTEEQIRWLLDEEYVAAFVGGNKYIAEQWGGIRQVRMYGHLQSRYNQGKLIYFKVYRGDDVAPATLQGYELTRPKFDGCWYAGREVRLTTEPGYSIDVYVNGVYQGNSGTSLSMVLTDDMHSVDYYLVKSGASGIDDVVSDDDTAAPVEYYDLRGVRIPGPTDGLYITRRGSTVTKHLAR